MLQDRGHCGCVPGSEGTSHPKARQCAHCGKHMSNLHAHGSREEPILSLIA